MSFTSSDPIASLLETLRRAQDGAAASSSSSRQASSSQPTSSSQPYQPYQYPSSSSAPPADDEYDPAQPQLRQQPPPSYRAPKAKVDLKALSFPQSLPYLAQLAEDPEFISKLNQMKDEQDRLEKSLWKEREAMIKESKSNVEKAKSVALVSGQKDLSPFEKKALVSKLEQQLQRFHTSRLLPQWDALLRKQQVALEALGVPTMGAGGDRDRQRRVVAALEGMVGED
ncbi:hypothetical protein BDY24DRAFT_411769 [Mrakia frigida]|uniref:uncharacterized protein n=1 Tax=Mrakia frigida TaxID=29902 RepID=UPI003FCC003C